MDGRAAPPDLLLILVLAFAAAVPCRLVARRLGLPFSALMMLCGFLISEGIVAAGGDTGLRWTHFNAIAVWALLPVLAFTTAVRIDVSGARRHLGAFVVASLPVPALTVLITAGLLYLAMGHPLGFPLEAAVLTAALAAALDGGQSLAAMGSRRESPGLPLVVEVESVVADSLAAVLVASVATMALAAGTGTWGGVSTVFLTSLAKGLALGIVAGAALGGLLRVVADDFAALLVSVAAVFGTVLVSHAVTASAVAGVVVLGLTVGARGRVARRDFLRQGWSFAGFACMGTVYFLAGVSVHVAMFTERWLAMLICIGAALAARVAAVQGCFRLAALAMRRPMGGGDLAALSLGGIRGAFALALVLALPLEASWWWTVQCMVYGVVIFDLFVLLPVLSRAGNLGR